MTLYRPVTFHSDSIVRPLCPECGTRMQLARIEPEKPGYEIHAFVCPTCTQAKNTIAKIKPSSRDGEF